MACNCKNKVNEYIDVSKISEQPYEEVKSILGLDECGELINAKAPPNIISDRDREKLNAIEVEGDGESALYNDGTYKETYTALEINEKLGDYYTKEESDNNVSDALEDYYTKSEVDNTLSSALTNFVKNGVNDDNVVINTPGSLDIHSETTDGRSNRLQINRTGVFVQTDEIFTYNGKEVATTSDVNEVQNNLTAVRNSLQGQIDDVQINLTSVENNLQGQINTTQESIRSTENRLEGQINEVQENINAATTRLQQNIDNLETDLQGQIDSIDNSIDELDNRVSTNTGHIAVNTSDIESIREELGKKESFRGYFQTNTEIEALEGANGDYAWSAETGTVWIYNADTSTWEDSGTPIPSDSVFPYEGLPLMDGSADSGSSSQYARGDHRHPSDTTKANVSDLDGYFPLVGNSQSNPISGDVWFKDSRIKNNDEGLDIITAATVKYNGEEVATVNNIPDTSFLTTSGDGDSALYNDGAYKETYTKQEVDTKLEDYALKSEIITTSDGDGKSALYNDGAYKSTYTAPEVDTKLNDYVLDSDFDDKVADFFTQGELQNVGLSINGNGSINATGNISETSGGTISLTASNSVNLNATNGVVNYNGNEVATLNDIPQATLVENNLTSTSTINALSANMGRELAEMVSAEVSRAQEAEGELLHEINASKLTGSNVISVDNNEIDIIIDASDKVLAKDMAGLKADVNIGINNNIISLYGKNNQVINTIELTQAQIIENAYIDTDTNELVIVFITEEGTQEVRADLSQLITPYLSGDYIALTGEDSNVINVDYVSLKSQLVNDGFGTNYVTTNTNQTISGIKTFSSQAHFTGISTSGNIVPATSNDASLGTTSLRWNGVYASTMNANTLTINSTSQLTGGLTTNGNITPIGNLQSNLGSSTNYFANVYAGSVDASSGISTATVTVTGAADLRDTVNISGLLTAANNIVPQTTNVASLGLTNNRWLTVYTNDVNASRNVSVAGTLTLSTTPSQSAGNTVVPNIDWIKQYVANATAGLSRTQMTRWSIVGAITPFPQQEYVTLPMTLTSNQSYTNARVIVSIAFSNVVVNAVRGENTVNIQLLKNGNVVSFGRARTIAQDAPTSGIVNNTNLNAVVSWDNVAINQGDVFTVRVFESYGSSIWRQTVGDDANSNNLIIIEEGALS